MQILVRYGEIGLKSAQVQSGFKSRLKQNLQDVLDAREIDGYIVESEDRIFARVEDEDAADAVIALSMVPGVVSVSPVVEASLSMDDIVETGFEVFEDDRQSSEDTIETFAVSARRAGEHEFTSKDIENELGQRIVDETDLDVDLDDPDLTVSVEVRYKQAYIYTRTVDGVGGLPVNDDNGVVVHMVDRASTVAAYLLMKRGCKVYPVYTGHEPDMLEEDMETLRQFDPNVKLTVMKGTDRDDALEQACGLFDCDVVALSYTAEEIEDLDLPYVDAEILLPVCGMSQDEVLELYADISYVELG